MSCIQDLSVFRAVPGRNPQTQGRIVSCSLGPGRDSYRGPTLASWRTILKRRSPTEERQSGEPHLLC